MHDSSPRPHQPIHGGIQFFSIVLFAAFAISTAIVALNAFWPAGIALAAFYAHQWSRIPTLSGGMSMGEAVDSVKHAMPGTDDHASGNASFDAYRAEMMERLEKEQSRFEDFLGRLRDAKDKAEFEDFMDDRARLARAETGRPRPDPGSAPELRQPA